MIAETAIVAYRLSLADQGIQTYKFRFHLSKQPEVSVFH
jgi:hypothetical protein